MPARSFARRVPSNRRRCAPQPSQPCPEIGWGKPLRQRLPLIPRIEARAQSFVACSGDSAQGTGAGPGTRNSCSETFDLRGVSRGQ
jgi:hypothetical protein